MSHNYYKEKNKLLDIVEEFLETFFNAVSGVEKEEPFDIQASLNEFWSKCKPVNDACQYRYSYIGGGYKPETYDSWKNHKDELDVMANMVLDSHKEVGRLSAELQATTTKLIEANGRIRRLRDYLCRTEACRDEAFGWAGEVE